MKKLIVKDAWLEPNGKLHEVQQCCHYEFAESFFKKNLGDEGYRKLRLGYSSPVAELHKMGWVRIELHDYLPKVQILGNCIDLTRPMRNTMCPSMNQTQLRIAKQICEEHGASFHQSINDKRFW